MAPLPRVEQATPPWRPADAQAPPRIKSGTPTDRATTPAAPRVEGHAAPEEEGAHAGGGSHRRGRSPYPQSSTSTPIRPARAELAQRSPREDLRWGGGKEGREEGLRGSGGAAARVSEHRRIRGIGGSEGVGREAAVERRLRRGRTPAHARARAHAARACRIRAVRERPRDRDRAVGEPPDRGDVRFSAATARPGSVRENPR